VTHPKIGFVGLGQMGSGMASNLTNAGHQLYVHDQSASAMARFADTNAICCQSLSEIAQNCSLVFLCLPSAKEVDEVLFGPKGLVDNLKAQISIIDTSTLERSEALQFHGQLAHKAIQYADCPVSGLPARAREGKLTLMFGGSQTLFEQVSPFLELLGTNIVYCGEVGSGQLMKAVNNIIYNINIVALCEILPLGVAAGISIDALEQVVNSASSRSFAGDHFIPRMLAREFEGDFPLAGAYKDILNMQKVATEKQALTPLMNAMISSYQNALADGLGDEPKSAIIKIYEKVLGVEFKRE